MAKMTMKAGDEFALALSILATNSDEIAKKAIFEGASILADEIKKNLNALPVDKNRLLKDGEKLNVITRRHKEDLIANLGISPIDKNNEGDWNVKVGFDGYGTIPTQKYPQGLPNRLLARSIESGSSVREKHPFVRPAVDATKDRIINKMGETIEEEIKKQGF